MTDTRTDTERLEALQKRADRLHTRINRVVEDLADLNADIAAYEPSPKMPGAPT